MKQYCIGLYQLSYGSQNLAPAGFEPATTVVSIAFAKRKISIQQSSLLIHTKKLATKIDETAALPLSYIDLTADR